MGGLFHCINRCFHGGILYEPSGEPVFFEDESLLPKDREGNTIHFQKVGGETEIEGEGQEKTMFENLAILHVTYVEYIREKVLTGKILNLTGLYTGFLKCVEP